MRDINLEEVKVVQIALRHNTETGAVTIIGNLDDIDKRYCQGDTIYMSQRNHEVVIFTYRGLQHNNVTNISSHWTSYASMIREGKIPDEIKCLLKSSNDDRNSKFEDRQLHENAVNKLVSEETGKEKEEASQASIDDSETALSAEEIKYKRQKSEMRSVLIGRGVRFIDENTVVLAESHHFQNEELQLKMRCLRNSGNQLFYVLFESDGHYEYGVERPEQRISDDDIFSAKISVDGIIRSFCGKYDGRLSDIKVNINAIHQYRLLKPVRSIDSDRLPMEMIISNLKEWILNNTADVRIKPVSFKGKDYVALVCPKGCSNKSVNNIFREIFSEIAPKNDFAAFKGELFRRGLLCSDTNYDCVDIQKTISSFKARELGTEKCKIICFDFGEQFINTYHQMLDIAELDGELEVYDESVIGYI